MEARIFPEKPYIQRVSLLRGIADGIEQMEYAKRLSVDQINEIKEKLVELNIHLSRIEGEKKEYMASIRAELKPMKAEVAKMIDSLNSQTELVVEEVFKIVNQEEGMVGYYNAEGDLVQSRKILPAERQLQLKSINQ